MLTSTLHLDYSETAWSYAFEIIIFKNKSFPKI